MDRLIEENMGLVVSVVNSFKPHNATERDDYTQAGRIGLWKALKKYDVEKGAALSTFAWNPIRWEIIKEIKSLKKDRYLSFSLAPTPVYIQKEAFWESCPENITNEECELLELRRMGYTLDEVAGIAGRSKSYIKKVLYRAINKVRESDEQ
tara:strand:- start:28230 stop:28682 length:453 start_codon:yes stop_codon:yes gene_type:complete